MRTQSRLLNSYRLFETITNEMHINDMLHVQEDKPEADYGDTRPCLCGDFLSASTLSLPYVLQIGPRILRFAKRSMLHFVINPA
jgi:hypothetical protein